MALPPVTTTATTIGKMQRSDMMGSILGKGPWREGTSPMMPVPEGYSTMHLYAHRGWSARYPENSLAAFTNLTETAVLGAECDVRMTRDGRIVLCHDADLRRWGGSRVPLAQRTWAEVRAEGLPLLEEVLEALPAHELLVELKPHGGSAHTQALVERTIAVLRRGRALERSAVLCFAAAPLALAADLAPRLRRIRNVERLSTDPAWIRSQGGCFAIDGDHARLTPEAMAACRRAGLPVFAYTVNTPAAARRCRDMGVAAIISNHADLAW
jgi:glycerophosphoryl diester phosphodiesterase